MKKDETGVHKNLLQEVSQRVGASLPPYTTFRSGLGHLPVFTCTVELAGISFTGVPAKNKKQVEKNAAMTAWLTFKQSEILSHFMLIADMDGVMSDSFFEKELDFFEVDAFQAMCAWSSSIPSSRED
ncbi:hypothetical protein Nepgr_013109 [Nepenthes gracilis]|uniref:DRBM domain-containing protein n=1 Tax=Nepenthes gracilis TaxID=150966 RepID=A0AAD3SH97_NEPGR|nr:hypothetical protein Nepgr_013109 [Nepenthes gracilis]